MKKNIQNSIDTNWKSYQAVAQANIHSLENLEIISYTRFKSSTRLYVGDDILVNNKLARIGTVFVDEVYGHRYSIAYPEMSLGHEEIIFAIEWVEDVSLLPGDNNLTGFRLEQVDANELVIDMQGEMTSLTVTPYKTLVTPTNSLDDIDNIFQSEFKGTDTIDVIGEGPSETITDIETISSGESTFTEYQLVGTNVDGLISVNGVEQVVESEVTEDTYKSGNISNPTHFDITNTQLRDIEINFTFNVSDIGTEKYLISASSSSNDNDHRYYLVIKPDRIFINFGSGTAGGGLNKTILNNTDYKVRFIVNDNICIVYLDDIKIIDVSNVDMPTIHDRGLTLAGGASVSMTDISIPTYTTETTTFTTQTVDTNSLEITTDGTFDSLDYSTTISTPTEIVTDITKTITQDIQQENWTKYQLEAKNLDGTITVNGVEQVVETVIGTTFANNITHIIGNLTTARSSTSFLQIGETDGNTVTKYWNPTEYISGSTISYGLAGWDDDNDGVEIKFYDNNTLIHSRASASYGYSPSVFSFNYNFDTNSSFKIVATNKRVHGSNCDGGVSFVKFTYDLITTTSFLPQLVDTNTLELAVSGTVERIDTKTYINEDVITTIQDTDSTIELEISDLPYTLTQEVDQTDFNNYLIAGKGMTNQTVVTVNDLIQTVEFDIEGVSTLETTNDLLDIIRVFDYSVVVDEKTYDDITFTTPTNFSSAVLDYPLNSNLLLDNLNYATITEATEYFEIAENPEVIIDNTKVIDGATLTSVPSTILTTELESFLSSYSSSNHWNGSDLVDLFGGGEYHNMSSGLASTLIFNFSNETTITNFNFDYRTDGYVPASITIKMDNIVIWSGIAGTDNLREITVENLIKGSQLIVETTTSGSGYVSFNKFEISILDTVGTTLTQEVEELDWYQYQLVSTNVASDITVNGLTQIVESEEIIDEKTITTFTAIDSITRELEIISYGTVEEISCSTFVPNSFNYFNNYAVEHKAYSKQTDIDGNVTHSFNTTEEYPYTDEVLPTTIREFEFPSLSVSYYDIDLETTIGPIDKQYDSINISEENITFDYNDETKANTNKISFEPENIKEIIIKSKKIQEDN